MRQILFGVIAALCAVSGRFPGVALRAAETFNLTVPVESPDFPNLNTALIIEGDVGAAFEFTGDVTLTSAGVTGDEGPQGWSLGVHNTGVDILAATTDGTIAANVAQGGLEDGGFKATQIIDPAKNAGKQGMVAAMVLSLTLPVSLPPNTAQIVVKNRYKATIAAAESVASVKLEDGLRGKGQPVQNNVTFKGATAIPTFGETKITIRKKVVAGPEQGNCNDGVDNDQDGKIDCADSDCADDPTFCGTANETGLCNDGKDNDKDGKVDCADSDCAADPVCQAPPTKGFDIVLSAEGSHREGNKNVVDFPCDKKDAVLTVMVSIEKTHDAEPNGAQGWSISVGHDKDNLEIQNGGGFPTIDGTDAGAIYTGGFKKTEVVDPAKNNGKAGFVSAVVLSLTQDKSLDPAKSQTIALAKYKLAASAIEEDFPQTIQFVNGLRGSGQPVENIITVNGASVTPTTLIGLQIACKEGPPPESNFIRGNANDDGKVNIADPIWIINELVRSGPKTKCQDAADANDDGLVDLSDAMYLIQWRFLAGPAPTAPFPACGPDPKADTLNCPAGAASSCP